MGNRPIVLLLLPVIIGILVSLNLVFEYYTYSDTTNLGMWGNGIQFPYGFTLVIGPFVVFLNALLLSSLFNTNGLLDRNTYITSLVYVVYFSFYHSFYQADGLLLAHTFLIGSLFQLFGLQQNADGRKKVFNAGFMAGLAISFHPASMLFAPFIYFAVVVIRPFILRELLLLFSGIFVPLIYAFIFQWYFGGKVDLKLLTISTGYQKIRIDFLVTAALFLATILFSFLALNRQSQKTSIRTKKLNRVLFWISISAVLLGLYDYVYFGQIERFSLLLIPVSVFLTFAFTIKTYFWVANSLFYIVLFYSLFKLFL